MSEKNHELNLPSLGPFLDRVYGNPPGVDIEWTGQPVQPDSYQQPGSQNPYASLGQDVVRFTSVPGSYTGLRYARPASAAPIPPAAPRYVQQAHQGYKWHEGWGRAVFNYLLGSDARTIVGRGRLLIGRYAALGATGIIDVIGAIDNATVIGVLDDVPIGIGTIIVGTRVFGNVRQVRQENSRKR